MESNIILCVDDDTVILNALRSLIVKTLGSGSVVEIAETGQDALEICADFQQQGKELGVVIVDFIMPMMRGDELLIRLHEISPRTIKIMLTGQSDLHGIKRTINQANLYRFLEKPFNNADMALTVKSALHAYHLERELMLRSEELERSNKNMERLVMERTRELAEKNAQLESIAVTDRLTKLYNRLKLDQVLEDELARTQRYASHFSLILLDVDHFKSVNDTHGHPIGDLVLIEMARILDDGVRKVDVVGRWGGEEFLIVCRDTRMEGVRALAEKLRQRVAVHVFPVVGKKTCSFGVTEVALNDTITQLMARVDEALYRSKANGRNRVECAAKSETD
ncbi:two-component system, cell cycle response regulator [Gammaproteobacteria bacterium]